LTGLPAGRPAAVHSRGGQRDSGSSTLNSPTSSTTPRLLHADRHGTSGTLSHTANTTPGHHPAPDFAVSVHPPFNPRLWDRAPATTANITAVGGIAGTVNLGVTGLPSRRDRSFHAGGGHRLGLLDSESRDEPHHSRGSTPDRYGHQRAPSRMPPHHAGSSIAPASPYREPSINRRSPDRGWLHGEASPVRRIRSDRKSEWWRAALRATATFTPAAVVARAPRL